MKLNLGSGHYRLEGFENLDAIFGDVLPEALRRYPDQSVELVRSEHFIEHLNWSHAVELVRECHRVLRPGGLLRFSCPDLRIVAERYLKGQIDCYGGGWTPETPAQMMNEAMTAWGHRYQYDAPEMERLLRLGGFKRIRFCERFEDCLRHNFGDLYAEAIR